MKHRHIILLAAVCATSTAYAEQLSCYVNPKTDAHMCFAPVQVRTKDGISTAPLYTGGPNSVRKTSHFLAVNCTSQVLHIKDRDGVSFGGGQGSSTEASRQLVAGICDTAAAKKPKKN